MGIIHIGGSGFWCVFCTLFRLVDCNWFCFLGLSGVGNKLSTIVRTMINVAIVRTNCAINSQIHGKYTLNVGFKHKNYV